MVEKATTSAAEATFVAFEKKRTIYLIAGFLAAFVVGLGYTWSIVQTPIVQALGGAGVTASVALCYTLTVLCSTMSPTLLGGFTRHLKPNQMLIIGGILFGLGYFACGHITTLPMLYLTYGVGTGVGAGLIYPTMMGYSASLFPDRPGMASGLMAGIYGGAAVVWSPILASAIESKGLTSTFNVIGILSLVLLIGTGFIAKPIPEGYIDYKRHGAQKKAASKGTSPATKSLHRGEMVRTGMFYVAAAAFALGLTSGMMVISQASQILQATYGMTPTRAAVYVSLFSFMSMAGRIVWGAVTDMTDKYVTLCIICAIPIIAMGALAASPSIVPAVVCMSLTALCYGGFGGTITPITSDLFGPKYITENYGVMYLMFGIAGLIGPRVAVRFGGSGDYSMAFAIGCGLAVVSFISAIIVRGKVKKLSAQAEK